MKRRRGRRDGKGGRGRWWGGGERGRKGLVRGEEGGGVRGSEG